MANPVGHVIAYKDELGPANSHGTGSGTTSRIALAGGLAAIYGMTFKPGDYVDVVFQLNHDIDVPPVGNVVLDAHVHWTAVAAPAAGATVIWEFEFLGAKPTLDGSASFPASSTVMTQPVTHICDGNETRKHFLTDMGDISIPIADYGHSYVIWGTLRMKSTATIAAGKVALLAFDLHKRTGQFGTAAEYA